MNCAVADHIRNGDAIGATKRALNEICDTKIWVRSLASAEPNVGAEHNLSGEEKGKASAESLVQICKVEIASSQSHFPGVVKNQKSNRADDSAVVFRLHEK